MASILIRNNCSDTILTKVKCRSIFYHFFRTSVTCKKVLFLVCFWLQVNHVTATPPAEDYTIYSLFIYNFIRFTQWPSTEKAFTIGITDSGEANQAMQKMAKLKSSSTMEIAILNTLDESQLSKCQIIFVTALNKDLALKLAKKLEDKPIMIVTEDSDLTQKGATFSFKVIEGKLRFQVNNESAKQKGLKISNSLLSMAEK